MTNPLPPCLAAPGDGRSWAPPLDVNDLLVRLEMDGVTEAVAHNDYGFTGLRQMASVHLPRLQSIKPESSAEPLLFHPWREYMRGVSFAFPLLICAAAMAMLKFSLWGGDVDANLAAAIGLGTVGSFVASGGVVQVMANRSLFFSGVKEFRMSENCSWRWVGWGAVAVCGSALALLAFSAYFELLPSALAFTATGFHICLGLFWLAAGLLYVLDKTWVIVTAVVAGIGCVVALRLGLDVPLPHAQIAGILLVSLLGFAAAARHMRRKSRADSGGTRPQTLAFDLFLAWPYFVFGTLYYLFLFADRVMAWTASTFGAPLSIQFRGGYETALDVALVAFIVSVGWVLPAAGRFHHRIREIQRSMTATATGEFNQLMRRWHSRALLRFAPLAIGAGVLAFALASGWGLLDDDLVRRTTLWAVGGYPLLVLGLFNASLLIRLARPAEIMRPLLVSTAVNLVSGYILSRTISYEWAVAGFFLGSLCFAVLSTLAVRRHLANLDFHYYASAA